MDQIPTIVSSHLLRLARRKNPGLSSVEPRQHLIEDLALDSLDLAELVASLEMTLNRDPFSTSLSITDCPTVADVCRAYAS